MLVFFLKGSLPWQGLKTGTDKYTRIMEKKLQIPTEILCYGLPDEISIYLNYCKSLRFEDRPDYDYLRGLFIKLLGSCSVLYGITKENLKFDWCVEDQNYLWQLYNQETNPSCINNDDDSIYLGMKEYLDKGFIIKKKFDYEKFNEEIINNTYKIYKKD